MRVLYLMANQPHSHDYVVDYLYVGLCAVLGRDNVTAWPENESLHGNPSGQTCELCKDAGYSSDQAIEKSGRSLEEACEISDIAILATQPGDMTLAGITAKFRKLWPASKPVVAVDSGDSNRNEVAYYRGIVGRPLTLYFKRELPLGATWGIPFPISCPSAKVPRAWPDKAGIFYRASSHGAREDGPGAPRIQIASTLELRLAESNVHRDIVLNPSGVGRLTPDEYGHRMARSLVGISWNGWPIIPTWDCARFWEHFAFAVAQVAEKPRVQIPHAPIDGKHCVYATTPDEAAELAADLVKSPHQAIDIARAGLEHYLTHHTSEHRAAYLLNLTEMVRA